MSNIHAVDQENVADIMNRINEALEDTQYEAVGYDNTGFFLTVAFDRKFLTNTKSNRRRKHDRS